MPNPSQKVKKSTNCYPTQYLFPCPGKMVGSHKTLTTVEKVQMRSAESNTITKVRWFRLPLTKTLFDAQRQQNGCTQRACSDVRRLFWGCLGRFYTMETWSSSPWVACTSQTLPLCYIKIAELLLGYSGVVNDGIIE